MSRTEDEAGGDRCIAGRYRLRAPLGRGGMGTVWLADDDVLGRQVAVKELFFPPGLSPGERDKMRQRTLREARAAARLDHPGAVSVYDVVEEDDRPCIVMQPLEGRTLAEVVREDGPVPPRRAAEIGLALLDTLEAAHRAGIVHRDVKPGNVIIGSDGRVTLTDFGIAVSPDDPSVTTTGLIVGSPAYVAPERVVGRAAGPESDLWSLGATLFAAVEGRPPFDAGEPMATLNAVAHGEPAPFRASGPLADVLTGLLERDPDRRATVEQTRRRLADVLASADGQPPTAALDVAGVGMQRSGHTMALPVIPEEATTEEREPAPAVPAPAAPAASAPAASAPAAAAPAVATAQSPPARAARAAPAQPVARRRRPGWLLAAAVLVVLCAVAAGLALTGRGHPRPAASRSATPPSAPASSAAPARAAGGVPAGWVRYTSPDGWSVAHPPGWRVVRTGGETDFYDPAGGRHLRIDSTTTPGPSAIAAWQQEAAGFAASHAGYQLVALHDVSYRTYQTADWQFTWRSGAVTLEAVDRGIVLPGHGYGLFFESRQSQWSASQPVLQGFYTSFQP